MQSTKLKTLKFLKLSKKSKMYVLAVTHSEDG